jgi:hypothetical protein
MLRVLDAVEDRVAQVDVGRGHVDLRPQYVRAIRKVPLFHGPEEFEVLAGAAVAVRRVAARLGQRAAVGADFLGALAVDIGEAALDEVLGRLVHEGEIVARVERLRTVVRAEPAHRIDDRIDVLLLLLLRIGVVEAQVAAPAVLLRQTTRGRAPC